MPRHSASRPAANGDGQINSWRTAQQSLCTAQSRWAEGERRAVPAKACQRLPAVVVEDGHPPAARGPRLGRRGGHGQPAELQHLRKGQQGSRDTIGFVPTEGAAAPAGTACGVCMHRLTRSARGERVHDREEGRRGQARRSKACCSHLGGALVHVVVVASLKQVLDVQPSRGGSERDRRLKECGRGRRTGKAKVRAYSLQIVHERPSTQRLRKQARCRAQPMPRPSARPAPS